MVYAGCLSFFGLELQDGRVPTFGLLLCSLPIRPCTGVLKDHGPCYGAKTVELLLSGHPTRKDLRFIGTAREANSK